jgi:hypothetical protein
MARCGFACSRGCAYSCAITRSWSTAIEEKDTVEGQEYHGPVAVG